MPRFGIIEFFSNAFLRFRKGANTIDLKAPTAITTSYAWTLPAALPGSTQALSVDSTGQMSYQSLGTIAGQNANNVAITGGTITGLSSLTTSAGASFGGSTTIGGNAINATVLILNRAAGTISDIQFHSGGVGQMFLRADAAGNAQFIARNDDGSFRDSVATFPRDSSGTVSIARPVSISGTLSAANTTISSPNDVTSLTLDSPNGVLGGGSQSIVFTSNGIEQFRLRCLGSQLNLSASSAGGGPQDIPISIPRDSSGGTIGLARPINITANTESTSTTTGDIRARGIGVTGRINAGGTITAPSLAISSSTFSFTQTASLSQSKTITYGATAPSSPAVNDEWWEWSGANRPVLQWFWDGSRWLSVDVDMVSLASNYINQSGAAATREINVPIYPNSSGIWIEQFAIDIHCLGDQTTGGAQGYSFSIQRGTPAGSYTTIGSAIATTGLATGRYHYTQQINTLFAYTDLLAMRLSMSRIGGTSAPACSVGAGLIVRYSRS